MTHILTLLTFTSYIIRSDAWVYNDLIQTPSTKSIDAATRSLYVARRQILNIPKTELYQHPDTESERIRSEIGYYHQRIGDQLISNPIGYNDCFNNTLINRALFNEHYLLAIQLMERGDEKIRNHLIQTIDINENTILHSLYFFNCLLKPLQSKKFDRQIDIFTKQAKCDDLNRKNIYGLTPIELSYASGTPIKHYKLDRTIEDILSDLKKMWLDCGIYSERLIMDATDQEPYMWHLYSCINVINMPKVSKRLKELGERTLPLLSKNELQAYSATYHFRSVPKLEKCLIFTQSYIKEYPQNEDQYIIPIMNYLIKGTPLIDRVKENLYK